MKRRRSNTRKRRASRRQRRVSRRVKRQYGGAATPIHVILAANEMRPTLQALLSSLQTHGYTYEVIGLGKPWQGFQTKMRYYLEGIRSYHKAKGATALIALLDAFDTLSIKSAAAAAAAYSTKPRRMPILFSAETCCYGNCRKGVLDWYDYHKVKGGSAAVKATLQPTQPPFPDCFLSPTPVFLNSGMTLGPAAELEAMLTEMVASGEPDDQLAAGDYLIRHMDLVDLDVEERVFRNKIQNLTKLPDEGLSSSQGPALIHFPGQRSEAQQKRIVELYKAYK